VKYRLVVVTHGGDENTEMLLNTLASFEEMVHPKPTERVLIEDGARKVSMEHWRGGRLWSEVPQGFCKTAEMAWMAVAVPGCEWSFWLEHDFAFRRPVNLEDLVEVMVEEPALAQISLMRQPCNMEEILAGGVVAMTPEAFVPRITSSKRTERERFLWLEHARYFTTNPSLIRREIAVAHEWPVAKRECEGHHSISLREAGYSFGIWGEGEPWVEHLGERTGFGY